MIVSQARQTDGWDLRRTTTGSITNRTIHRSPVIRRAHDSTGSLRDESSRHTVRHALRADTQRRSAPRIGTAGKPPWNRPSRGPGSSGIGRAWLRTGPSPESSPSVIITTPFGPLLRTSGVAEPLTRGRRLGVRSRPVRVDGSTRFATEMPDRRTAGGCRARTLKVWGNNDLRFAIGTTEIARRPHRRGAIGTNCLRGRAG